MRLIERVFGPEPTNAYEWWDRQSRATIVIIVLGLVIVLVFR